MKINQSSALGWVGSVCVLGLVAGCGPAKPLLPDQAIYAGFGKYDAANGQVLFNAPTDPLYAAAPAPQLPAGDSRGDYCAIYTPQETHATAKATFLQSLVGGWQRDTDGSQDLGQAIFPPDGQTFNFDLKNHLAQRTALFTPDGDGEEHISFKRACLSQLVKDEAPYAGFRILELEADNNEGVVVFAAKVVELHRKGVLHTVLLMTDRQYYRFGSTDPLSTEPSVFAPLGEGQSSVSINAYPTHQSSAYPIGSGARPAK